MRRFINFKVQEHYEKSTTEHHAPEKEYSEATGHRVVKKFTGPEDDLGNLAAEYIENAYADEDITTELERGAGGYCELRITIEKYRKPESTGGGAAEEDPEPDTPDNIGDSQDSPAYTMSSSLVQVPILAHPKFAEISGDALRALKALMDGRDENELLDDDAGTGGKKIKECITGSAAQKAYEYISKGITIFNDVSTEATARWKGRSNSYKAGEIATPPGGFHAGAGRNWLCSGSGVEKNGSTTWCTASFRLSGPGGWDTYLYSGS